jgi:polyisoprenoid-binding protein YceI
MRLLWTLLALATVATPASALEVQTGRVDVTFHISHPAKEYDAFLLPDGGRAFLQLDPTAIEKTTAKFTIQVDHFNSDNTRRDSHMLEVLEGLVFPTIDWSVTSVSGATGPWTPGVHRFTAKGPLTVHGVTRELSVPVEVTVGGQGELTFGSSFTILLEDYEVERPTLVFVPIENELPITVKVETRANPALLAPPPAAPADAATPDAPEGEPTPSAPEQTP